MLSESWAGLDPFANVWFVALARLALIALLTLLGLIAIRALVGRLVLYLLRRSGASERDRTLKAQTLAATTEGIGRAVLLVTAGLTALRTLGVDVIPLLASASVVGVAVGFGATALVRDLFTGFFILLEDQFAVDDLVRIGEHTGRVERFTLRITQLRNLDGALITIPNGEIKSVVNLSKEWSRVNLDIPVPFETDVDAVIEVVWEVARELAADPAWSSLILEEPERPGVDQLTDKQVVVKLLVKTAPMKQFSVARELRRRIRLALAERGMPFASGQRILGTPSAPHTS